jgi:formylglycine-generating enzyme required for sulfatase activity
MRIHATVVFPLLLVAMCGGERGDRAAEIVAEASLTKRCIVVPAVSSRELCAVPPGDLRLGGGEGIRDLPKTIRVDRFWLASAPVTNAEYERFRPKHRANRHQFSDGDHTPVTEVTWFDANAYCEWLSRETGLKVRLPVSVEWQRACLGGTAGPYPWPDVPRDVPEARRYANIRSDKASPVGQHAPNAYGLTDMTGNVREWMADVIVASPDGESRIFPPPPQRVKQGAVRAVKNCAADNVSLVFCECNTQWAVYPHMASPARGFRILVEAEPDPAAHAQ